jgi:hypothetical protein
LRNVADAGRRAPDFDATWVPAAVVGRSWDLDCRIGIADPEHIAAPLGPSPARFRRFRVCNGLPSIGHGVPLAGHDDAKTEPAALELRDAGRGHDLALE